jgi:triacylglycerol esterase/lipase EstA (alpha/beta hydrolase family)
MGWRLGPQPRFAAIQVLLIISIALTGLAGFSKAGWAQTVINTIQDLQNINSNLAGSYGLGGNIDATGFNFTPIGGNYNSPFTGVLDGKGYTINNLIINTGFYVGLFSHLTGQVKNINLTNASIQNGVNTGANPFVGGIAGANSGSITNSSVTGTIAGTEAGGLVGWNDLSGVISQSWANVSVFQTSEPGEQGALAGQNDGLITQSYATGQVNGRGFLGGLVGGNNGTIQQSYSMAGVAGESQNFNNYAGGLVGYDVGTITQTYATGHLGGPETFIGGLAGFQQNPALTTASYWNTVTTGVPDTTVHPPLGGTGLTTALLQSGSLPTGFDPVVWVAVQGQYPQLQWQAPNRPAFPVVFVHGFCSDEHTWDVLKAHLIRRLGWRFGGSVGTVGNEHATAFDNTYKNNADFYTINFPDPAIDNRDGLDGWAADLHFYLQRIRANRGIQNTQKFIIVAHSAGGLASRAYLEGHAHIHYDSDVFHFVTYGTPHDGTPSAANSNVVDSLAAVLPLCRVLDLSASLGVKEMVPESTFLNEINGGRFPQGVLHTSLKASADDLPISGLTIPILDITLCLSGWDCVVPVVNQHMVSAYFGTPSRDLNLMATRTVTDRTHSSFDLTAFGLGVTPGESEDITGILWAIRRAAPGS